MKTRLFLNILLGLTLSLVACGGSTEANDSDVENALEIESVADFDDEDANADDFDDQIYCQETDEATVQLTLGCAYR